MATEYITLSAVLLLSLIGHNMTVVYATGIVLGLKILGLDTALTALGSHGLNWGIILLTAAILVPIATGEITLQTMIDSFKTPIGVVAVLAGLLAAVAGGGGLKLLTTTTELIPALIIGTMAGVIAFKGVAVGPLIAGGFTYFVMNLMTHFR
ncbi:DUF441 domain-containing protein [uncultured Selenomonas sp.]|uniref:DUF441 domain-containing protein n=1 Tax=uncultured Selenomonas sp. TaxID=159275 RepID=UPI00280544C9|nr:DUF441 domain-containing protein [uncultured Selenomonas sp.]